MPKKLPLAFPSEKTSPAQPGMNMRDYFAAHALPAVRHLFVDPTDLPTDWDTTVNIARRCYQLADAMVFVRDEVDPYL